MTRSLNQISSRVILIVCFYALLSVKVFSFTPTPTPPKIMSEKIEKIVVAVNSYKATEPVDKLEELWRSLTEITAQASQQRTSPIRQELLSTWLGLLSTVQKNIDYHYDPADPKNMYDSHVIPPEDGHGRAMSSDVLPSTIVDPVKRAEYQARVDANNGKRIKSTFQNKMLRLDQLVLNGTQQFFKEFYTTSDVDKLELSAALQKFEITANAKELLIHAPQSK